MYCSAGQMDDGGQIQKDFMNNIYDVAAIFQTYFRRQVAIFIKVCMNITSTINSHFKSLSTHTVPFNQS